MRINPRPSYRGEILTVRECNQLDHPVETGPIENLYHATTSVSGILERGFIPRGLRDGRQALGGGSDYTISMTQDLQLACVIAHQLRRMILIANGTIDLDDLLKIIGTTGLLRKTIDFWLNSIDHRYKGDSPELYLEKLRQGFVSCHSYNNKRTTMAAMAVRHLQDEEHLHPGTTPWDGAEEQFFSGIYFRRGSLEEIRQALLNLYNAYLWALGTDNILTNPVIWSVHLENFIRLDPQDVGVIRARLPFGTFFPPRTQHLLYQLTKSGKVPRGTFIYNTAMDEYTVYDYQSLEVISGIECGLISF